MNRANTQPFSLKKIRAMELPTHGSHNFTCGSLLRVALNQFCRDWYQVPEETTCALVGTGSKVKFRSRRFVGVIAIRRRAVRETHAPDALDRQRLSSRVLDQAFKLACIKVVS